MKKKTIQLNQMGEIEISFDYDPEIVEAVKKSPQRRYDKATKLWVLPPTPQNLEYLGAFAEEYQFEVDPILQEQSPSELMDAYQKGMLDASQAAHADLQVPGLGGTLYPFQKAGVAYAARTKRCFIADEMGLGKTVQALALMEYVNAYPALVICPAGLKLNWARECARWLPKRSAVVMDKHMRVHGNWDILIAHYELLEQLYEELQSKKLLTVVFDEAHYLKSHDSQRSRNALKLVQNLRPFYRLLLTGTPILNRPQELIHPLKILWRLDEMGGFDYFADHYCEALQDRGRIFDLGGAANLDELNQKLRSCCYIRRIKEQVLPELPEKQRTFVPVEMDTPAEYRDAERNYFSWLLQQAKEKGASAAGYYDSQDINRIEILRQFAASGKLPAVMEWIKDFMESGEKLVVFAHHLDVINSLAQRFSVRPVVGSTPMQERQRIVDEFQNNPDEQLIVLGLKVGSQGLTLHAASNVLFAEPAWTPAELDQAEDRLHRIGQRGSVQAWYLVARGTIEEDIYDLIERKRQVVDAATEGSVQRELIVRLRQRAQNSEP